MSNNKPVSTRWDAVRRTITNMSKEDKVSLSDLLATLALAKREREMRAQAAARAQGGMSSYD